MTEEFQQSKPDSEPVYVQVSASKSQIDSHFLTQWILACAFGYAIGMSMSVVAGENVGSTVWGALVKILGIGRELGQYNYVFASAVLGAVFGGIVGFSQWLVLRRYIPKSTRWIWIGLFCRSAHSTLSSIVFTLISLRVSDLSLNDLRFEMSAFIIAILAAVAAGILEWLVLHDTFPQSSLWIGARVVAEIGIFVFSFSAVRIFPWLDAFGIFRFVGHNLLGFGCGVLFGLVTGFALFSFSKNKSRTINPLS